MQLGRVIGTVVATEKAEGLEGIRFLIVQPLDRRKEPS
ncbi:MAG TPA: EutN/CcmL family microcompartment protein, partial [Actinomycetota bacterium]